MARPEQGSKQKLPGIPCSHKQADLTTSGTVARDVTLAQKGLRSDLCCVSARLSGFQCCLLEHCFQMKRSNVCTYKHKRGNLYVGIGAVENIFDNWTVAINIKTLCLLPSASTVVFQISMFDSFGPHTHAFQSSCVNSLAAQRTHCGVMWPPLREFFLKGIALMRKPRAVFNHITISNSSLYACH